MTFSPMPTNMDEARKEILVWRERYKRKEAAEQQGSKPLTDEQIFDLAGDYDCGMRNENEKWCFSSPKQLRHFVEAIEAAHGITGEEV